MAVSSKIKNTEKEVVRLAGREVWECCLAVAYQAMHLEAGDAVRRV